MLQDCLIIGGGLLGMLSARELAHAGLRVTIVERGEVGRESSWAGGGILSPLYPWRYADAVNRLSQWSQEVYPQLALALTEESGIDPEWTPSGLLVLHEPEPAGLLEWVKRFPMPLQACAANELSGLEPGLRHDEADSAWYLPGVAQIRNPRLVKAMRLSLERLGVHFMENTPVTELCVQGGE